MYELAYHIDPKLEEAQVKIRMQEVESLIVQNGGTVMVSREAKKVRLSYPIEHQRSAYMGLLDFSGPTDMLSAVNAQLKLQNDILRFLIIAKPEKELRVLGEQRARKIRTHAVQPSAPQTKKEITPGEEKEMEKKLEDVLEKI